jgi:peptidoglycan/LPS O-acetylase OafA/YrhL
MDHLVCPVEIPRGRILADTDFRTSYIASRARMSSNADSFSLGYRRGLDGLRGLAILLVLTDHGGLLGDGFGFIGVNTFFVLSGFLITCLLVLEYQASHTIKLSYFYLRRALRLLPALLAMLAAFLIYAGLTMSGRKLDESLHEAFWALFYSTNLAKLFQWGPTLQLAHTWSLSLEEQFYFCWPWLLLFLLRRNSRSSLFCWAALGAFVSATLRVLIFAGDSRATYDNLDRLTVSLDTRADSLMLGALVAIAVTSKLMPVTVWFRGLITGVSLVSVPGILFLGIFRPLAPMMVYAGWLLASMLVAVLILHLVVNPTGLIHRWFANPLLVYIGRISYSLYVWHFPLLKVLDRYAIAPLAHNWLYWTGTIAAALVSYYFIEQPCLRLKRRFQTAKL